MKKIIKNLAVATIVAGAVMASKSASAQSTFDMNDLYLGFQNAAGGGSANYIINLGPASGIIGGSTVVNLSSDFSKADFTSTQLSGTNAAAIVGGIVGGANTNTPSAIYGTQLRTSNFGIPSVSGSTAPGNLNRFEINNAYADISQLAAPAVGVGVLDGGVTWEKYVEDGSAPISGTYFQDCGVNPDSSITTGSVVYEDLYYCANSSGLGALTAFQYEGYFTFNFTGSNASVTFTPENAPDQLAAPTILSITQVNGIVTVVSTAIPTFHYQLQATASLQPTNWVNVGSAVVASSTLVTNTASVNPSTTPVEFYQVSAH